MAAPTGRPAAAKDLRFCRSLFQSGAAAAEDSFRVIAPGFGPLAFSTAPSSPSIPFCIAPKAPPGIWGAVTRRTSAGRSRELARSASLNT